MSAEPLPFIPLHAFYTFFILKEISGALILFLWDSYIKWTFCSELNGKTGGFLCSLLLTSSFRTGSKP